MTSKLTTDPQKWPEMTQIPKIGPLISRKLMPAQQKNLTPLIFSPEPCTTQNLSPGIPHQQKP